MLLNIYTFRLENAHDVALQCDVQSAPHLEKLTGKKIGAQEL